MNRLLFVAALCFVFATTSSAEPPVATGPAATTTTAVAGPAPVLSDVPPPMVVNTLTTQPHRMGLFGRIRARNTNPMLPTTAAYTATPMAVPATTVPSPMPTTTPMPMPGKTTSMVPTVSGTGVVVAGGVVEGSMVVTASGTTTMPVTNMGMVGTMPTTEVVMTPAPTQHRMGLFARMRARRGN